MKYLTRLFLDHPVAANLLMALILLGGLLSLDTLRVESFPQIAPSALVIEVSYPGGTAAQVDQGITQRMETAIGGLAGIKRVVSESHRGYARLRVIKTSATNLERLMEDVRNRVEGIVGFPAQAQRPRIYRDSFTNLAAFILLQGGSDEHQRQTLAHRLEKRLTSHPRISEVTNLGKRRQELVVMPRLDAMKRHGIDAQQIAERLQAWSLEYRSGELRTERGNIILRADELADNVRKLRAMPIIATAGDVLTLSQIAEVKRRYERDDSIVRVGGEEAIALMVSTSRKDNLLRVSDAIDGVLTDFRRQLPASSRVEVMADMAPYIEEQLEILTTNAWQGLLIILLLLGLFLNLKIAFWVAVGIPVSLAGTLWLMGVPQLDYSINDITLFGMILVLGILVDDAVVVGESVHAAQAQCEDPREAAWQGVQRVAIATSFGVLTTIAAFSPMLWIDNELARVLAGFSTVVILALIFSLIESKLILPTHLAGHGGGLWDRMDSALRPLRRVCDSALDDFSHRIYQPLLEQALRHRGTALILFSSIMLVAYGLWMNGHIRGVFFPEIPGRYATVTVTMDRDSAPLLKERAARHLERAAVATANQLAEDSGLDTPIQQYIVASEGRAALELTAELSHEALQQIPAERILASLRQHTGRIEGAYSQRFSLAEEPAGGSQISIVADDRQMARRAAERLKQALREQPGVADIVDDGQLGRRQLQVTLNARGQRLGLTQRQLAELVGGAFGNIEVQRLIDQGQETLLSVVLPERERRSLSQLASTPVFVDGRDYVLLGDIASLSFTRQADVLHRLNRESVINVRWRQNRQIASPESVLENLKATRIPELEAAYPGVSIRAAGEFAELTEVQEGFRKAMLLTLLAIFILLALPLKSYWQPLVIMSVIPFGFAGAIYGHGLMGLPVSLLSLFGMMAMTGVVINDSLVLMTRFNQLYREGMALKPALLEAGRSRMRAIFLTTVTTVCGLLPLLSEQSEQAQYLKPAAVSLVFGELFATPITLILVPLLLSLGHRGPAAATPPPGAPLSAPPATTTLP